MADLLRIARARARALAGNDAAIQDLREKLTAMASGDIGAGSVTSFTFNGQSAAMEGSLSGEEQLQVAQMTLDMLDRGGLLSTRTLHQTFYT